MVNTNSEKPRSRFPLYMQVLLAVLVGILVGHAIHAKWFGSLTIEKIAIFGELGKLIIDTIKALAVPLIFFAIVDGLIRTQMSLKHGWRLILICAINVSFAFAIGLVLINTFQPGLAWKSDLPVVESSSTLTATQGTLSPIENFKKFVPATIVDPFVKNSVISAVILAILIGAAIRQILQSDDPSGNRQEKNVGQSNADGELGSGPSKFLLEHPVSVVVNLLYRVFLKMLSWLITLVPIAVFGSVANVVAKHGLEAFSGLLMFLGFILFVLCIHALIYYPIVVWAVGRKTPAQFIGQGADAILTGLSTNSSLVTVPITLRCLTEGLGISQQSARLSTCIGTNLNNDGIMLYEAMAALFLAQAAGMALGWSDQAIILGASIMAGIGIAGIPEAGYVMLPLVLAVAGFTDEQIAVYWPLIFPVDWILARVRSGVNVMGDMTVAILLERFEES
jgi:Na+/H+-dicarboxylate symporter